MGCLFGFTLYYFLPRCTHCMHRGLARRKLSVRLSVCPSVCQTCDLSQNKRNFRPLPHEREFILVLWKEEWLEGQPLLPKILGQTDSVGAKTLNFNLFSLVALINTNRKSIMRFSLSLRWTSYVAPKFLKGGPKTQNVQNLNNNLRQLRNGTRSDIS